MRSYSQVIPTFWTRGSGKALRGNPVAQLLVLYFFTAPSSNMIGLYYLPFPTILAETGLTSEQVEPVFEVISDLVKYDKDAELVWIPESANYQLGKTISEKDKRHSTVEKHLEMIGDHPFKNEFISKYGESFNLESGLTSFSPSKTGQTSLQFSINDVNKGHPETQMPPFPIPIPVPNQISQISDQPNKSDQDPVVEIFKFWQKKMNHPTAKLDVNRRKIIRARMKDFSPRDLCLAIVGASKDDWIMGRDSNSVKKYDDFKTIFRDAAQVEKFIELSSQKRGSTGQIFQQDPEAAKAKAAETAAIYERKKAKDLEENAKLAESKQEHVGSIGDLLKMVK